MILQNLINAEHKKVIFKQEGDAKMVLAYHTQGNGIYFGGVRLLPSYAKAEGVKDA